MRGGVVPEVDVAKAEVFGSEDRAGGAVDVNAGSGEADVEKPVDLCDINSISSCPCNSYPGERGVGVKGK